jgi:DegV family protein with EDD domain
LLDSHAIAKLRYLTYSGEEENMKMSKVAVVTDSLSDLPSNLVEEFGITVVPYRINFGGKTEYRDGIDISPEEFYENLKTCKTLPVTSTPNPEEFREVYDKLSEKTNEIAVISLSSKISAGYQMAQDGVKLMTRQCRVEILDSQWTCMAEGFVAIAAARAAQAGAGLDEVINIAHQTIDQIGLCYTMNDLKYAERSGRIGHAQALIGSILKINPVLCMKNGEMYPYGRPRSRVKALDELCNFAGKFNNIERLAVGYGTNFDDANGLAQRLRLENPKALVHIVRTGQVSGAYTGPSYIYVAVMGHKQTDILATGKQRN